MIDIEAVLIDGSFPAGSAARACSPRPERRCARSTSPGIEPPELRAGALGPIARALGGASLPLFDRYLVDQHALAGPAAASAPARAPRPEASAQTRAGPINQLKMLHYFSGVT